MSKRLENKEQHPGYNDARVRVRYAETDQMGVVYHANYLVWFEVGRVELLRSMGFDYKMIENDGFAIAVVEVTARYKAPAKYDDELLIRTSIRVLRSYLIKFGYEVIRAVDGVVLAAGETTHVVVDKAMKKAVLPEKYAVAMQELLDAPSV